MSGVPIVCTLLPGELNARAADLLPNVARLSTSQIDVDNGYRFEFVADADCIQLIGRMIDAERQCCRFLRFQLTVEPNGGAIVLDVTGPSGTREFLATILAFAPTRSSEKRLPV